MAPVKKTILITGCSAGGVGASLASAFTHKDYHIIATARTPSKIPASLQSSPTVTVLALDITSATSIATAAEQVSQKFGKLDVLVNNAGGALSMPALDTSLEEMRKAFELNFFGSVCDDEGLCAAVDSDEGLSG